jgi:ABC-type branched-subunit amino acid transport system substrate-binding protein
MRKAARFTSPPTCVALCVALLSGCGVLSSGSDGTPAPITVMTWAPEGTESTNMPGMPAMAEAYAKYINAKGGINGHKLKVLTCNERTDPVAVANCVDRAVNTGVAAVVGSYSQQGASFSSALEADGIPYIGGYGITQDEFASPMSYPVNGGLPALLAGNGQQLAAKCSKVSLVRPDSIAGDQFPGFLDAGLRAAGKKAATDLKAADGATDYTSTAEKAIGNDSKGQCVTAVLGDPTATFFDSFRRLRTTDPLTGTEHSPRAQIASVLGSVTQSTVDSTGGSTSPLEGALITAWYPPAADPAWAPMKQAIQKYAFDDNRIDTDDPGVQTTWIAYTVFTQVVSSLGDQAITPTNVKRAFDSAHNISTGGLTPPLGWRDADLLTVPDQPRLVNGKITYQVVRDGRLVAARSGFTDVTKTLQGAPSGA